MAEEVSFGVARLRQAITNQATCCGQFELSIDSADRLCRECEEELARLAWAAGVPVPRDADGEVVPLDTAVLYTDKGEMIYAGSIVLNRYSWYARSTSTGKIYHLDKLHLAQPDSWKKLEEDAKLAPRAYLEKRGMNPEKTERVASMMADLVSRAKALAERDAKGADCD